MSGHSKWANIKNRKAAQDKKKTAVFTRLTREIIAAAKINPDPESPRLASAIERARAANLPNANVERAIKRSQGLGDEGKLEALSYDATGPHGAAFIIEIATDNKNRSVAELRHILDMYGATLAGSGAVRWQFSRRGLITLRLTVPLTDDHELKIIEAGAADIQKGADPLTVQVLTDEKSLAQVAHALTAAGFTVAESAEAWLANELKTLDESALTQVRELAEELDSHPDVTKISVNLPL